MVQMSNHRSCTLLFRYRSPRPATSPLFPYTTLFRSIVAIARHRGRSATGCEGGAGRDGNDRSEEHTSELQSHSDLVCRLLLEKKTPATARRALFARSSSR